MVPFRKESRQVKRAKARAKAKEERALAINEKNLYSKITNLLGKAFNEDQLEQIAKKTGVIKRKRELTASAFASVLFMGNVCDTSDGGTSSLKAMCSLLRKYFGLNIEPQALQKKN